jgi:hypothetical protein
MKISEILFEGPYDMGSDFTPSVKMDSYPSLEGLKRENISLGRLEREDQPYHFWLSPTLKVAKVSTAGTDEIGQKRQLIVVQVRFDNRATDLPVQKMLQVDTVYTHPEYRGQFLAGAMYILLARYGYTIVSDFKQYNGGKGLWRKMALESDARRFAVRIWSDAAEDWIRAEDGEPLLYNGENLGDDEVWHSIDAHMEPTTLLVLSHS